MSKQYTCTIIKLFPLFLILFVAVIASNSSFAATFDPVWPVTKKQVGSLYYYWNSGSPTIHSTQNSEMVTGIDVSVSTGTQVHAVESGTVYRTAELTTSYGHHVIIQHDDETFSLYAHLSQIKVSTGQHVNKNDLIGLSGSTGHSDGPHLHFEIYKKKGDSSEYPKLPSPNRYTPLWLA